VDEDRWTKVEERDGMLVAWQVPLPMDDGVVLRADVFRPLGPDPVPVLLTYGPYAKGLAYQDGYPMQWEKMVSEHPDVTEGSSARYQNWEVPDPEQWVPLGYACVRVDSRGAGWSPGFLDPWSPRETADLAACIEWAGTRPWSNGKVGLLGISYYAMNQWQVAGLAPEHLAAMVPWEGAADFYRDVTHHGGILCQFLEHWYERQVLSVQHGRGRRAGVSRVTGEPVAGPEELDEGQLAAARVDLPAEVRARPLDGPWYRERSADWSKVTVPFLSAANWGGQGLHPRGNFEAFTQAASEHKWLEVHGAEHWTHFSTAYGRELQRRFLDHFLRGVDNGFERTPRVLLQVRHPGERFEAREEHEWPLARTLFTRCYLHPEHGLLALEAPEGEQAASYEVEGDGLLLRLPRATEPMEVTGPLAARLWVASSTDDADLFLVVRLFDPDDREVTFQGALDPNTPIAQGWLRASHRHLDPDRSLPYRPYHTHDRIEPLTPGVPVPLDVEIWPTSIVVPPGYQLALQIRGKDYEYDGPRSAFAERFYFANRGVGPFTHQDPEDRPAARLRGTVTVLSGPEHPSWLLLPVVPPAR
jgi:predicted acyl esterase